MTIVQLRIGKMCYVRITHIKVTEKKTIAVHQLECSYEFQNKFLTKNILSFPFRFKMTRYLKFLLVYLPSHLSSLYLLYFTCLL